MARPLRIEFAGGFYHVVSHGNGRLWLFRSDINRKQFLKLLGACVFKYKVVVHGFVLMTSHVHMLIETPLPNLSQFMRKILSDYALYYNKCYQRRGSVFKSRYGSFLIQQDNYYQMVVKYLYNNPVKAGIVKSPDKYQWSSLYYLLHKRRAKEINWYNAENMLKLVGGKQGLIDLMASGAEELPMVYSKFIGDKEWADDIINENYARITDEISTEKEMKKGIVNPEIIIELVAQIYKISKQGLITGRYSDAKQLCLYVLYKETPLGATDIGSIFQMSKWAVFKTVERMGQRKKTKKEKRILQQLQKQMSNVQT